MPIVNAGQVDGSARTSASGKAGKPQDPASLHERPNQTVKSRRTKDFLRAREGKPSTPAWTGGSIGAPDADGAAFGSAPKTGAPDPLRFTPRNVIALRGKMAQFETDLSAKTFNPENFLYDLEDALETGNEAVIKSLRDVLSNVAGKEKIDGNPSSLMSRLAESLKTTHDFPLSLSFLNSIDMPMTFRGTTAYSMANVQLAQSTRETLLRFCQTLQQAEEKGDMDASLTCKTALLDHIEQNGPKILSNLSIVSLDNVNLDLAGRVISRIISSH